MVGVGVGDEDVADLLVADGGEERVDVGFVRRAGVDDGNLAAPHDERRSTEERVRTRVLGHDPTDAGQHLIADAVGDLQRTVELEAHDPPSSVAGRLPGQFCKRGVSGPIVRSVTQLRQTPRQ